MAEISQAHIIVNGIVQGVGFRWFVQRVADSLQLPGSVKNLNDGTVEIYVEGEKVKISSMIRQIESGNRNSRVESCKVKWSPAEGKFQSFQIIT